jgi:lipopolysaccharide transport system permease protein
MPDQRLQLLRFRSLLSSLVIAELKLRYKNSFLGFIWSFLEPLLIFAVLYLVFTHLLGSGIKFYPLYLLLGIITWNMYTRATSVSMTSLISRSGLVSKIYLPREIFPLSACITSFIMMMFELIAFGVFVVAFQLVPGITILLLPLILIVLFVLCSGLSLLLSIATVYFRDLQYIWSVLNQAAFFTVPIILTLDVYPENLRSLLLFNPMTSIIDTIHKIVLYNTMPGTFELVYPIVFSFAAFGIGYLVFKKFEFKVVEIL